jgi:chromosome segregation ATPase
LPPNAQKLLQDVEQYIHQQKSISDELKSVIEETRKNLDGCQSEFKNIESQTSYLKQDLKSNENQVKNHQLELNEQTKDFQLIYQNLNRFQNGYHQQGETEETLHYFNKTTDTLEQRVDQALQTLQLLNQQIYTLNQSKVNQNYTEVIQEAIQSQHTVINNLTDKVLNNHQTLFKCKLTDDRVKGMGIGKQ